MGSAMGEHAWSYETEKIDRLPDGQVSVGVGDDLMAATGMTLDEIATCCAGPIREIRVKKVGALVGEIVTATGVTVRVYMVARQSGKCVDIGTRRDMEEIRMGAVCDLLERMYPVPRPA